MAISVGAIVGNIYYAQPLFVDIARDFQLSVTQVGVIAMLMQVGTAVGMLIFVPLGDTHERRRLISTLVFCSACALAAFGTARNQIWLAMAGLTIGLFASTVHVIIPYAAHLAPDHQRGRVVGFVFSGLMIGILLARAFSGWLGAMLGWRAVFGVACCTTLILAAMIRSQLPRDQPDLHLSWFQLVRSAVDFLRHHAVLREATGIALLSFSAFSAFWTTLVFHLEAPPLHYGSTVAGLFGLVGAAGAAGAPLVGYLADRRGPRRTIQVALLLAAASCLIMMTTGNTIAGLIAGYILVDLAIQSAHVSNQTRIYSLDPGARSRLNMVYMVCAFTGGSLGSFLGTFAWRHYGWTGVCVFSLIVLLSAFGLAVRPTTSEAHS